MAGHAVAESKQSRSPVNIVRIFSRLGIVRALVGQALGTFIGYQIVAAIGNAIVRSNFSDTTTEAAALAFRDVAEAGWFAGALVGVLFSLLFCGVLSDWLRWMVGKETPLHHGAAPGMPEWSRYFGVDVNHKVIGIQYGVAP